MILQGSFYTKNELVNIVYDLLEKHISNPSHYVIVDTSCGYGSFLNPKNSYKKIIGGDIDKVCVETCKKFCSETFEVNGLLDVKREHYNLSDEENVIIVGNPPYNDVTSQTHKGQKGKNEQIDKCLISRDLGISFLRSYDKLRADYVCVLHPLSYLIKKTNFSALKDFAKNYKLIDGVVIGSDEFEFTSSNSVFPILVGLYVRGEGMSYEDICNHEFLTKDGRTFRLSDMDFISNYGIAKYPNQQRVAKEDAIGIFYTMRDINALKRSKTFMDKVITNSVLIDKEEDLKYYCYVDVFKQYAHLLPYYLGNLDVFIDHDEFIKIYKNFIKVSSEKNLWLEKYSQGVDLEESKKIVEKYFEKLFKKFLTDDNNGV